MNHAVTETVSCNLCGGNAQEPFLLGRDRLLKHPGYFPLVRCRHCGLVYQSPRPVDMTPFYEGSYLPFESKKIVYRTILRRHHAENTGFYGSAGMYYGVFKRVIPWAEGRLLDVGCATGDFLVAMDGFGWEVHGTDFSATAVAQANQRLSQLPYVAAQAGDLKMLDFPPNYFDVVTLWHVIEHLPDPRATMVEVHRILKPGGICLIQTPHLGSLESFVYGRYWAGLDSPRHLWIFSHLTLQALLARVGLRVWLRPPCNSYGNVVISTTFFGDALAVGLGATLFRKLHHPLLERLANYAFRFLDQSGAGSQLTVAAVKPLK